MTLLLSSHFAEHKRRRHIAASKCFFYAFFAWLNEAEWIFYEVLELLVYGISQFLGHIITTDAYTSDEARRDRKSVV